MQAFKSFSSIKPVMNPVVRKAPTMPAYNLNSSKAVTQQVTIPKNSTALVMRAYGGAVKPLDQKEVTDRVVHILKNFHRVQNTAEVKPETHFATDLGLDSLDQVEVVMALEDEFLIEIPDADADKIHTCGDAIKYIMTIPYAR